MPNTNTYEKVYDAEIVEDETHTSKTVKFSPKPTWKGRKDK
jgi:hypothetical protein